MSESTNTTLGLVSLTGDLTGTALVPTLRPSGVIAGSYLLSNVLVNKKGLVLSASSTEIDVSNLSCATEYACGFVTTGNNIVNSSGVISIPDASESTKGVVRIGPGLKVCGCLLTLDYPKSTTSSLGFVKVPESGNIDVDVNGNISIPTATTSSLGIIKLGSSTGTIGTVGQYTSLLLPVATSSVLGGVKESSMMPVSSTGTLTALATIKSTTSSLGFVQVGDGLSVTNGNIFVNKTASPTEYGMIKIGNGLDMDGSDFCSIDATEILASTSTVGCVQIGSNLSVASGVLSIPDASTSTKGVMSCSTNKGLLLASGVLQGITASTIDKGLVVLGTNISSSGDGVISISDAGNMNTGVVRVGSGFVPPTSGDLSLATTTTLAKGGLIVGQNFNVDMGLLSAVESTSSIKGVVTTSTNSGLSINNGILSGWPATNIVRGIVLVGSNFNVSGGVISVPASTVNNKGVISVSTSLDATESYFTITSGVLDWIAGPPLSTDATDTSLGVVQVNQNTGLTINSGVLSGTVASTVNRGMIRKGTNVNVDGSGTISVSLSANTTLGVIKSANADHISITSGLIDAGSNIPKLNTVNTWTQVNGTIGAMGGTGLNAFPKHHIQTKTLTSNLTMVSSDQTAGTVIRVLFTQDATGGRTITFPATYKFNKPVSYNTAPNSQTLLTALFITTTTALCYLQKIT